MIIGAIIGALIAGGLLFAAAKLADESFWWTVSITFLAAVMGAVAVGKTTALILDKNDGDPPSKSVRVDESNGLYSGCIPVDLAKKQVENQ